MRLAVIGTAGRGTSGPMLSRHTFELMMCFTKRFICAMAEANGIKLKDIVLVSGGSSWTDHLAVQLFLEMSLLEDTLGGLHIFLPCKLLTESYVASFEDSTAGSRLSELHAHFSNQMGRNFNSINDIVCAMHLGAVIDTSSIGFHARNSLVANVDTMIAFTWENNIGFPVSGGTRDTWDKCMASVKCHVPLQQLVLGTVMMPPNLKVKVRPRWTRITSYYSSRVVDIDSAAEVEIMQDISGAEDEKNTVQSRRSKQQAWAKFKQM